jgi:hypothetical protein
MQSFLIGLRVLQNCRLLSCLPQSHLIVLYSLLLTTEKATVADLHLYTYNHEIYVSSWKRKGAFHFLFFFTFAHEYSYTNNFCFNISNPTIHAEAFLNSSPLTVKCFTAGEGGLMNPAPFIRHTPVSSRCSWVSAPCQRLSDRPLRDTALKNYIPALSNVDTGGL